MSVPGRFLNFEEVSRRLALEREKPGDFIPDAWAETQAAYPAAGPEFLQDRFVKDETGYLSLPVEIAGAFLGAAAEFRRRPEVCRLAWHCHRVFPLLVERGVFAKWLVPALGELAGMFPALVLLSRIPKLRESNRKRGIPESIALHTLSDIEIWMRVFKKEEGCWGLGQLNWLSYHIIKGIYRLGRLQFVPDKFGGRVRAYRRRGARETLLLAEEGTVFRRDGFIDGANGLHDEAGRWTARLKTGGGAISGNPIDASGRALKETREIEEAAWEPWVAPGDPMLEMHIPAGEPLAEDACKASFAQARGFFPRHFPEVAFKGMCCSAWLLDPTYSEILPSQANLPKFQKLFCLFPDWGNEKGAFYRVFGDSEQDLKSAPRDTGLRRAILDLYASGRRLVGGGGGIVRE